MDLAYAVVPSPVGRLVLAASPRGLVTVAYEDGSLESILDKLAARASPRLLELPARLDEPRRELDEYFEGRRRRFELRVDWAIVRGFTHKVLQATARIPYGSASSYLEVAARAGSPRAVRAAGNALGANPMPIVVPCHRVLRTGGGLGGYTGGLERKRFLLELERQPAVMWLAARVGWWPMCWARAVAQGSAMGSARARGVFSAS